MSDDDPSGPVPLRGEAFRQALRDAQARASAGRYGDKARRRRTAARKAGLDSKPGMNRRMPPDDAA